MASRVDGSTLQKRATILRVLSMAKMIFWVRGKVSTPSGASGLSGYFQTAPYVNNHHNRGCPYLNNRHNGDLTYAWGWWR